MAKLLLNIGIGLLAAWIVALGAVELLDLEPVPWHDRLLEIGAVLAVAGAVMARFRRTREARGSTRCVYCRKKVRPGQIYCDDHFRRGLQRVTDQAKANTKPS